MANYKYSVIDDAGKVTTGSIEASTVADASRMLRSDGKHVTSIEVDNGPSLLNMEVGSPKLKTKELVLMSRQLASLLAAGVTVVRALDMLYQQMDTPKSKKVVGAIYESIQQGKTLTEAFKEQSDALPVIMISMVAAGEEAGRLDEVMERLADHFAKDAKTKNKVSSAMVYPKMLFFVTVGVTILLMTFVVPGIGETIADLGGEMPALTRVVLGMSDSLIHYWYIYIIVVAILYFGFTTWKKSESGSLTWAKIMVSFPIVGKATRMNCAARFTRTFATLLRSGISVLQSMEITSNTLDNVYIEKKLYEARIQIRKGVPLSKAIRPIKEFPPMIYAMVAIGEESGTLDQILDKAADFFEDEADAATAKLVSALEPLMIVIMAIIVGLVVGAVYLPILSMASFINF